MASNYTENYNLCQWEATDQVLRTDFNEDNKKIDTALHDLSATFTAKTAALDAARRTDLLLDQTLSSNVETVSLDLSQINLREYFRLDLVVHATATGTYPDIYMRFNGRSDESYYPLKTDTANSMPISCAQVLPGANYGGTAFVGLWGEGSGRNTIIWSQTGAHPKHPSGFIVTGGRYTQLAYTSLRSLDFLFYTHGTIRGAICSGSRFRLYGTR